MSPRKSRTTLATAAALLALGIVSVGGAAPAADAPHKERLDRCYGVNACKGQSLCATAKSDCKGLNDCKGKGVVVRTKSDCLAQGGGLTEPKTDQSPR
jgi:uncharacterized membrane protein